MGVNIYMCIHNVCLPALVPISVVSISVLNLCLIPEMSPHSGIHVVVLLSAGGQTWWSSLPPPSAWTYEQRERLSVPATRVRQAGDLHQPAGHPVTTTTQHWFNWICVWSKSSSLKPETWPDACPTMMANKVIWCSLMLWQRLPQWLFN